MPIYFLTFEIYKYAFVLFLIYSFDNDDMKSSKRHVILLSLIFALIIVRYMYLLYKHQWNTRWAFARKHDIFTSEKSPLLWLHNKSRRCFTLGLQKIPKWNGLVFHWCWYKKQNITWPLGNTKFLLSCWKTFQHYKFEEEFRFPRGHLIS